MEAANRQLHCSELGPAYLIPLVRGPPLRVFSGLTVFACEHLKIREIGMGCKGDRDGTI